MEKKKKKWSNPRIVSTLSINKTLGQSSTGLDDSGRNPGPAS